MGFLGSIFCHTSSDFSQRSNECMARKFNIYTDGASTGNPGPSGIGIVIYEDGKEVKRLYKYVGEVTNNVAEYLGLIYALQEALVLGGKDISINTDSELMANQTNGKYKVKDKNLRILYELYLHLATGFDCVEIKYIPREKNKEADKLANKAIETRFNTDIRSE